MIQLARGARGVKALRMEASGSRLQESKLVFQNLRYTGNILCLLNYKNRTILCGLLCQHFGSERFFWEFHDLQISKTLRSPADILWLRGNADAGRGGPDPGLVRAEGASDRQGALRVTPDPTQLAAST